MLHAAFESLLDILELQDSRQLADKAARNEADGATSAPRADGGHDAGLSRIAQNLLQMGTPAPQPVCLQGQPLL